MTPDSEGLHAIANTTKVDLVADIVFVHGLGGSSHSTWRYSSEGKSDHFFWPAALGADLPNVGIWSVGYPAGFTHLGKPGMIIEKRAGNFAQKLANCGIGKRPVIFITHSMGGLVVKSLVVGSQVQSDQDRIEIASAVRAIVFCGTPHRGSDFATAAGKLGRYFSVAGAYIGGAPGWIAGTLLGRVAGTQAHVNEMAANADPLDILHDGFIRWQSHTMTSIHSYAENIGLGRTRKLLRPLQIGVVVPRASANPGIAGYTVRDIDEDHLTLVKPQSPQHDVYAGTLRFVRDVLRNLGTGAQGHSTAKPLATVPLQSVVVAQASAKIGTPTAPAAPLVTDISRIIKYAPETLIGRESETRLISDAWAKVQNNEASRPHVLTFVALGGEGKTALVARWAVDLQLRGWPGCDAVFAWSFYSQGTREQAAASSDLFLVEALKFFGDSETAASNLGAYEKARRLAQLVGERRALLILDGVEPLQYSPTSPTPGELKDQGLAALLKGLAGNSRGLCIVTTRYSIADLKAYRQTTAPEKTLLRLSPEAGLALLKSLGVKGDKTERRQLVEDVRGHALTLNLIGSYLNAAHDGDIRKRNQVKLQEADAEEQGGHAFRVMDAYVQWFKAGGTTDKENERGKRAIAVLRLLGMFDRPVPADCLAALCQAPLIPKLTKALVELDDAQRNRVYKRLEEAKLITVNRDAGGTLVALDAHPLVREYFATQVQTKRPEAWRAAHRRLFEHLCATTKEGDAPTLEDLQPLYHAAVHGCHADMRTEALNEIYVARILRGAKHGGFYSTNKLGAYSADLQLLGNFFEVRWNSVAAAFSDYSKAWIINQASSYLRATGRVAEAREAAVSALEFLVHLKAWDGAATNAGNLSEIELLLGDTAVAIDRAQHGVSYADQSGSRYQSMARRSNFAYALLQAGNLSDASSSFREADAMQQSLEPEHPILYSGNGFHYCEALLLIPSRRAWLITMTNAARCPPLDELREVEHRVAQTLQWATCEGVLLDIARDAITVGQSALILAIFGGLRSNPTPSANTDIALGQKLVRALTDARRSGVAESLICALMLHAWYSAIVGQRSHSEGAKSDLDEAWEIAERGPMPLFLADIHLHRARLFGPQHLKADGEIYPWKSSQHDLAEARRLIEKHGYWRRKEELADAEAAAKDWSI